MAAEPNAQGPEIYYPLGLGEECGDGILRIKPDRYEEVESGCRYTEVKTWFDPTIPVATKTKPGVYVSQVTAECTGEGDIMGSRIWLERMDEAARRLMVINVNLDSVGGAFVLTAADIRDKVHPDELDQALRLATTLTWHALAAADATLSSLAAGATRHGA
jgi:hypothetical protein